MTAATGVPEALAGRRSLRDSIRGTGIGVSHVMSAGFLVLLILVALLAPVISPYDPLEQDLSSILQTPSAAHWFGNDDVGRDILSRILSGARTSLAGSFIAGFVALAIGVPIGLIAGSVGGWVDSALMRVVDAMLAFPAVILAMAIVGSLGPGIETAMFAIGIA